MLLRNSTEVRLASDVGADDDTTNRRIAIPLRMVEEIRVDSIVGPILYQRKTRGKKKNVEPAA
jgi:hypothetical protein